MNGVTATFLLLVVCLFCGHVLSSDSLTDCRLLLIGGPCDAYFPRWFYNTGTRTCESFIYGGCGGNANNFLSEAECTKACVNM
ncbi:hypothetical protein V1264_013889 [Littorina saxatilis]|uniref:BPTI/Kunitz inhibitor domain-containing protein n=2 Tax=Littorina saxatilis TaxID=31220 RepID=A0AAN9BRP0_9CAEN